MASLYTYQSRNVRKTWILFIVFFAVVLALGWFFGYLYQNPGILLFAVVFSIITAVVGYWSSDTIALSMARAVQIEKKDNPLLWNTIENLCITAGLPMPRVFVTPDRQINAFATGRDPQHAAIAVTAGALERLDKEELQGVLAHELSHVGNRDILISTVAVVLAGVISLIADIFLRSIFWGGGLRRRDDRNGDGGVLLLIGVALSILAPIGVMLIQLAISRRRESLADASGSLLTRYPQGLVSALKKIAADHEPMPSAKDSTAHLWIDNPFKGEGVSWWHKMLMTHPPIEERIKALEDMAR